MKVKRGYVLGALLALVMFSIVWVPTVCASTEEVEIVGTVYGSNWDVDDNATNVYIFTTDGEEIAVSKTGKGVELLKLEGSNVKAMGTVATDEENGIKTLTVRSYSVVE